MLSYLREVNIKVNNNVHISGEDLTIEFDVPFDDNTEPNESKITIYNLSESTINQMRNNDVLTLNAGYKNDVGLLLSARISSISTAWNGPTKVTTITVLDSQSLDEKQTAQKAYAAGTKGSYILTDLASQLGVPIAVIKIQNDKVYTEGYTVEGKITDKMKEVAKDCGVSVYINKGRLYIRSLYDGDDAKFTLTSETGLIGSPEWFEEQDVKGWRVKCLLQHRITTASFIAVKSSTANGTYRVRKGKHTCTSNGFITEMELV